MVSDPFTSVVTFENVKKNGNFVDWFDDEFLPVAKQANLSNSETVRRLRSSLSLVCKKSFDLALKKHGESLQAVVEELNKQFSQPEKLSVDALFERKMRSDESVQEYSIELRALYAKIYPENSFEDAEIALARIFRKGIPQTLLEYSRMYPYPETLTETVNYIKHWEKRWKDTVFFQGSNNNVSVNATTANNNGNFQPRWPNQNMNNGTGQNGFNGPRVFNNSGRYPRQNFRGQRTDFRGGRPNYRNEFYGGRPRFDPNYRGGYGSYGNGRGKFWNDYEFRPRGGGGYGPGRGRGGYGYDNRGGRGNFDNRGGGGRDDRSRRDGNGPRDTRNEGGDKRNENKQSVKINCQICGQEGHIAPVCEGLQKNFAALAASSSVNTNSGTNGAAGGSTTPSTSK